MRGEAQPVDSRRRRAARPADRPTIGSRAGQGAADLRAAARAASGRAASAAHLRGALQADGRGPSTRASPSASSCATTRAPARSAARPRSTRSWSASTTAASTSSSAARRPFRVLDRFESPEYPDRRGRADPARTAPPRSTRSAARPRARPSPSWRSAPPASGRSAGELDERVAPTRSPPGSSCPPRPSSTCSSCATRTSGWTLLANALRRRRARRSSAPRIAADARAAANGKVHFPDA